MHVTQERHTWSQCKWLFFFLFPALKLESGLWAQLIRLKYLVEKGLGPMVSNSRLLHIQLFFSHPRQSCFNQCTIFPPDWSEDLLTIPLGVLPSGPRFLGKSERREPSGVGRRVAGLRTYLGDIVRPGFSIRTTWYLRILWSDIHKWPLPFRSFFTWWLVKIVCPQRRVLKHLPSGLQ